MFVFRMHLEYRLATVEIRRIHDHLAVKSAGTKQRAVENFGPICRRQKNHADIWLESVHFHQQRIQSLFALVVDGADMHAALPANGIQFINENDAGCMAFGLVETNRVPARRLRRRTFRQNRSR